ncbi:MAG TPA: hypothetical protein VF941_11345 [Clostridia bacterium]
MNQLPEKITIKMAFFLFDGGTINLHGYDENGNNLDIHLNWSIKAQISGDTQLIFSKSIIPKRSPEEEHIIKLLENADYEDIFPPSEEPKISSTSNRIILGEDIKKVMEGMDEGHIPYMKSIVNQLLIDIRSDTYLKGSNIKGREEL